MKQLLCLLFLIFLTNSVVGQKIQGETVFMPSYSDAKGTWIDTARVVVVFDTIKVARGSTKPTEDTSLEFELIPGNLEDQPRILLKDNKIPVKISRFESGITDTFSVPIAYNSRSKPLEADEVAYIVIKGKANNGHHIVRISHVGGYESKPFWIEIGANVDLAEQKFNNLFGGVFLYKRDWAKLNKYVWLSGGKDKSKRRETTRNLAIAAGVYESKASTISRHGNSSFSMETYYDQTSLQALPNDNVNIYTDTGVLNTKSSIQNIGLFFSPQARLTRGDANTDGIYLFCSFYAELVWQHVNSELDYGDMVRRDTFQIKRNDPAFRTYSGRQASQQHDFFSHYEGFGFPIFAKEGPANLYVNPVFGLTNQPSAQAIESVFRLKDEGSREWSPFYLVQFRLSEEKYGLSFSGEVRQLIGKDSNPIVTLLLSKKFNLHRLVEFSQ